MWCGWMKRPSLNMRKYRDGDLPRLLTEDYRKGSGRLDAHSERLKRFFEDTPPHTVNQAIEMIERETRLRLKNSACRAFCGSSA